MRFALNESTLILIAAGPLDLTLTVWNLLFLVFACIYAHLASINCTVRHGTLFLHHSLIHSSHLTDVGEGVQSHISQLSSHELPGKYTAHHGLNPHRRAELPLTKSMLVDSLCSAFFFSHLRWDLLEIQCLLAITLDDFLDFFGGAAFSYFVSHFIDQLSNCLSVIFFLFFRWFSLTCLCRCVEQEKVFDSS